VPDNLLDDLMLFINSLEKESKSSDFEKFLNKTNMKYKKV